MKKIIIADDSSTSRMFIKRCFEIAGWRDGDFVEAVDGQNALTLVKESENVDLLVTDLNMPNMDGEELLDAVKGDVDLADLPVLVITSAGNPAKEKELMTKGALAILNKPISPAVLIEKLKGLTEK
jgi:two-component system chemotaxis response regulator CheY